MLNRREAILAAASTLFGAGLAGCGWPGSEPALIGPGSVEVAATEARRHRPGATLHELSLEAVPGLVELGGPVRTWTFGGGVPGPELRARAGDRLRISLSNRLPAATAIHWHGIAIRNDMDGVIGLTQPAVEAGAGFLYDFTVPDSGTYLYYADAGVQADRGLYGALIVEDRSEPLSYDLELVVVLDDCLDGVSVTPEDTLDRLRSGQAATHQHLVSPGNPNRFAPQPLSGSDNVSRLLGGDAGDVSYPVHLLNGRPSDRPGELRAKPGQRLRLRVVSAASDTVYRIALGDHRLTITHVDGHPVRPEVTDSALVAIGERFDALVTLGDGAFPLTALAEGKGLSSRALVITGSGRVPDPSFLPAELARLVTPLGELAPVEPEPAEPPELTLPLTIAEDMTGYRHRILAGGSHPTTLQVPAGRRVRLELTNRTTMYHVLHLHGHTMRLAPGGLRKDTIMILPGRRQQLDILTDNPGQWRLGAVNPYQAASGLKAVLAYVS